MNGTIATMWAGVLLTATAGQKNKVCAFAPSQFEQNPGLLPGAQSCNAPDENDKNQGESS